MVPPSARRVRLPAGTVTFLFTDIEGSTRLLQDLGQVAFRRAVEDHMAILRRTVGEAGGVEVSTDGDALFAAFQSPSAGLRAAVDAQRRLLAHAWPGGVRLVVRMGLHTGEGTPGGDDYLGLDVHRAARIAAAGHGGQILVSAATAALVEQSLPDETVLRDLGDHRLKDLAHPERLLQVVAADLPGAFPALRTLDSHDSNLPTELTAFIGRDREVEEVVGLVRGTRFVTLTGPGGSGKSRLALRVGALLLDRFANGVFFVPLAPITDPDLVPATLASVLGLAETPDESASEVVIEHLRERELLLLLDNFEQILPAARFVTGLLESCPGVTCLVTSRAVLHVSGEREYSVPPLSAPDPAELPASEALARYDAVALFLERARAVDPHFEMTVENAAPIAEITTRLDGLPLAIELAAARVKILTSSEILDRLTTQRLSGLLRTSARDAPDRHQSLRGTIRWSYDLLRDEEQALFRRLGVFVGGFTLAAAGEVVGDEVDVLDGVAALVDNSLVRRDPASTADSRYDMLETVREFAAAEMGSRGELGEVRQRHAQHFLALADEAGSQLLGDEQVAWLDRLEDEHDNLRAAFAWALEHAPTRGAGAAGGSWRFFQFRSHLREGTRLLRDLLARPEVEGASEEHARAAVGLAGLLYWQGDYTGAVERYEEALAIFEELGDRVEVADNLYNLSTALGMARQLDRGRRAAEDSLALWEEIGDEVGAARAEASMVWYHYFAGEHDRARARAERAEAVFRDHGMGYEHATAVSMVASMTFAAGDVESAWPKMVDALGLYEQLGDRTNVAGAMDALAMMAVVAGDVDRGLRLAGAAERIRTEIGGGVTPGAIPMTDPRDIARETLSEEQVEAGLRAGRELTFEEALAVVRAG